MTTPFMNVEEAARYIRVSKSLLQHLAADRVVPYYKLGRRSYFRQEDLDRYVETRRIDPEPQDASPRQTGRRGDRTQ